MTKRLALELRLQDPDGFYEKLVRLHEGLSDGESNLLNAKLLLVLANHIGDEAVLEEAMALARRGIGKD